MKLLNVHEIISFDQSDFAKEYISLTTALRTATSSKVKKKMWKFYNNVLFGKSLQDAAKNIDVDIVWNDSKANTKIKSSRFRGRQILDPDTLAISTTPPKISRRMAFAVGFSILEFSKLEMYQVSSTSALLFPQACLSIHLFVLLCVSVRKLPTSIGLGGLAG